MYEALMDVMAILDMQIPALFMGDFNGTVAPDRDYPSGEGSVCPLLTRLLGPGGPLRDFQLVVSPESFAYTFRLAQARISIIAGLIWHLGIALFWITWRASPWSLVLWMAATLLFLLNFAALPIWR